MTYYKIPLNTDLSETSYRARYDADDVIYIDYNEGKTYEDWAELSEDELFALFDGRDPFEPLPEPEPPEPYQPTNAEVAQMISDLQTDLIIAGVIEV